MMDNDNGNDNDHHGDEGGGGIFHAEITSTMKKSYPKKKFHQMKRIHPMTMRVTLVVSSMLMTGSPTTMN